MCPLREHVCPFEQDYSMCQYVSNLGQLEGVGNLLDWEVYKHLPLKPKEILKTEPQCHAMDVEKAISLIYALFLKVSMLSIKSYRD